jgi:hypothetical protein
MRRFVSLLAAGCWLLSLHLMAQDAQRGPDSSTSYHVPGVDVLAIPGKPFSAKSKTEWTRKLEDGSTLQQHLTANLARDSQGRVYRERRSFMPGLSNEETRLTHILIYDPVAKSETICTVAVRKCVVSDYQARTNFRDIPAGPFDGGKRYLNRESLGSSTMDGLEVTGTRETITVAAGTVGNETPLVSTREFWYSAELQTNLAVTRKLPVEGLQVVQLSEVNPSEPPAELFQTPAGYAVEDVRTTK